MEAKALFGLVELLVEFSRFHQAVGHGAVVGMLFDLGANLLAQQGSWSIRRSPSIQAAIVRWNSGMEPKCRNKIVMPGMSSGRLPPATNKAVNQGGVGVGFVQLFARPAAAQRSL